MDIVFAVVPFADAGRPAIGVSLLKAEIAREGFSSRVEYCNLDFASRIGLELYQRISSSFAPELLVGEWLFADDLFGSSIPDRHEYLEQVVGRAVGMDRSILKDLLTVREHCQAYLDECAKRLLSYSPKVVGFTTTFHQNCACLALAKRLHKSPQAPVVVFGGANCEGEMGLQLIQSFPWIDFVCCGEADLSFPVLLKQILHGSSDPSIPGVLHRSQTNQVARSVPVPNLDELPIPDFDDYFEQLAQSPHAKAIDPYLLIETSRGCWWGAKNHCTFCGLNGDTLEYRSKSPERAFSEMELIFRKHRTRRIGCVDNVMDLRYVDTLFPKLEASGLDLDLFYEIKSNVRYEQVAKLRRGGVRHVQPGIESLSDDVLRRMGKGCRSLQNIQLLRWCEEVGIEASWNVLAGFPGESPSEYDRMAKLIPLLTHLNPPGSCAQIRLDRFSPFHARAAHYGFRRVRPARAYYYVYPFGRAELARLAYFFDYDYADGRQVDDYLASVRNEIGLWWETRRAEEGSRPALEARFADDGSVTIVDTRPVATAKLHRLIGAEAAVLRRCDKVARRSTLLQLPEIGGDENRLRAVLESLMKDLLVVEQNDEFLTLATFKNRLTSVTPETTHADLPVAQASLTEPLLGLDRAS